MLITTVQLLITTMAAPAIGIMVSCLPKFNPSSPPRNSCILVKLIQCYFSNSIYIYSFVSSSRAIIFLHETCVWITILDLNSKRVIFVSWAHSTGRKIADWLLTDLLSIIGLLAKLKGRKSIQVLSSAVNLYLVCVCYCF